MKTTKNKFNSFPIIFPIRYAIVIADIYSEDPNWQPKDESAIDKYLFKKLLNYLQEFPLTTDSLEHFECATIAASLRGELILNLATLYNTSMVKDENFSAMLWCDNIKESLNKSYPNEKILFSTCYESYRYKIGLVSYKGFGERPIFYFLNKHLYQEEKPSDKEFLTKFGYSTFTQSQIKSVVNLLEDVKTAKADETNIDFLSQNFSRSTIITMPYSELWNALDRGENDGIIPTVHRFKKDEILKKIKLSKNTGENPQYIQVLICSSWGSLFVEELRALFKSANFCNNCQKILPFNSKRKYCVGNIECERMRAKIRKRKSQKY